MPIPRTRRELRKIIDAIPKGEPNGLYIHNTNVGEDVFISHQELSEACQFIMQPELTDAVEAEFGKMHYTKDPTYNMRKK